MPGVSAYQVGDGHLPDISDLPEMVNWCFGCKSSRGEIHMPVFRAFMRRGLGIGGGGRQDIALVRFER